MSLSEQVYPLKLPKLAAVTNINVPEQGPKNLLRSSLHTNPNLLNEGMTSDKEASRNMNMLKSKLNWLHRFSGISRILRLIILKKIMHNVMISLWFSCGADFVIGLLD